MTGYIRFRRSNTSLGNIRRSFIDTRRNIDWVLMGAVGALSVISWFIIYSATRPRLLSIGGDPFSYVQRQIVFVIIGIIAMAAVMWIDYVQLRGNAELLYAATLILLVFVLVLGGVIGGAHLSFNFGPIALQPSEFSKVTTLLLLCGYLADADSDTVDWEHFVRSLVIVGVPALLVLKEPDLGSASIVVAALMGVLLVAGARGRYVAGVTGLGVVSAYAAVVGGLVKAYQLKRITAFLHQNSDSASLQALTSQVKFATRAVATGGLFGKGFLQGPLTNGRFIPVQSTDFVFSAVGEQFGLVGGMVVLGLIGVVLWRVFRIARMANDRLGTFLSAGIFTMILWQSFQNIGMTMGVTPVSGVPLPFVSYGGSHTVAFAIMVGIVQSVHMRRFR